MPLPIPEILQNASELITASRAFYEKINDNPNGALEPEMESLRAALTKINPADLKAVMDEVGAVFFGMSNLQIRQIASAPDFQQKKFALVLIMEPLGLQPIQLTLPLTIEQAQQLIKSFQDTLKSLTITEGKLILDSGNA